jgi:hypothetical protein
MVLKSKEWKPRKLRKDQVIEEEREEQEECEKEEKVIRKQNRFSLAKINLLTNIKDAETKKD